MNEINIRKISKKLCFILRHHPEEIGISLDEHGWTDVKDILNRFDGLTFDLLQEIVDTDKKQRYSISPDKKKIRCNYGHSVKGVFPDFTEMKPPKILYHGTAYKSLDSIMDEGLKKMTRNFVHMTVNKKVALDTGARHGSPVLLEIDAESMYNDGHIFYHAENYSPDASISNRWYTDNVPAKYITIEKEREEEYVMDL